MLSSWIRWGLGSLWRQRHPASVLPLYDVTPSTSGNAVTQQLFLAGGITGCPDWQQECIHMLEQLGHTSDIEVANPRRTDWDETKRAEKLREQIAWEHLHLEQANLILFWFPEESLCPITLLELGKHGHKAHVRVGCHPGYKRRQDIILQMALMNPHLEVVDSLASLCSQAHIFLSTQRSVL